MFIERYLQQLNNYFENTYEEGVYTIEDGALSVRGKYLKGQYIRIMDSILNNGVYKIEGINDGKLTFDKPLRDETFENGIIVGIVLDNSFIDLIERIEAWEKKVGDKPIVTESIPNYSVSFNLGLRTMQFERDLQYHKKMRFDDYAFMRNPKVRRIA